MTTKGFQDSTKRSFPTLEQLEQMDRDLSFHPSDPEATTSLSKDQVEEFNARGFLAPLRVLSDDEVGDYRQYFDGVLARALADGYDGYSIVSAHIKHGRVYDLLSHPAIVGWMSDLLGTDLVCWGAHYFCKVAGDEKQVTWHQDANYWPITPARAITAWLAVDDVDVGNGCMRFVTGSHRHGPLKARDATADENSVLAQSVDGAEQYGEIYDNELKAGEVSLHSDMLLHSSQPNRSERRRAGLALRYVPVEVRATMDWNSEGVLASGSDPSRHWANPPRPQQE